jgi:hypothetical protein
VVEFPMPRADTLPGQEARYAYMSTFHWMPLLNGYSGYYPVSYFTLLNDVRNFPNGTAIPGLRRRGARYLIVHTSLYIPDRSGQVLIDAAMHPMLSEVGEFDDGVGRAVVFLVR